MAFTKKIEKIAAFRLEMGKMAGTTVPAWAYNGNTVCALAANHGIPYLSLNAKGTTEGVTDDSIEGAAFADVPVQAKRGASLDSIEFNMRYDGMDRLLYWMMGYEDGGTSPVDLGGGSYSHLFELDRNERELAPYRSDEDQAVGQSVYDRKNRYACLGVKMATNDYRYPFLLCSGGGFTSEAGQPLKMNVKGIPLREDRGSYNSAAWTIPAVLQGSSKLIMHHHLNCSIGLSGTYTDIGVKSVSLNLDTPLFVDQDSETGLFNGEPVLSGQYSATLSITISRHSVDTWLALRDNFTTQNLKLIWSNGAYEFGIYIPEVKLSDVSVSEDDVANVPINFTIGKPTTTPFTTEVGSNSLIQNGLFFIISKNTNSTNEMRRE